ncbi:MAG: hypothetical protein AMS14_02880 [Planctomycetes bacterium DG_20]|nr:MAG: hypothetical protein AMS14_02880 [Planctomycetes bacterium DG_20]
MPPGATVTRRATRQNVRRRGAPARAVRARAAPVPVEEPPRDVPVGDLKQRRLESPGTGEVSSLRDRTISPAAERPAAAPSAAPRPAPGFLGTMLRGGNLARAVVLSDILGPPKGLRDL